MHGREENEVSAGTWQRFSVISNVLCSKLDGDALKLFL